MSYTPDVYANAATKAAINSDSLRDLSKKARIALEESPTQALITTSNNISSANHPTTYTHMVCPYVLTYKGNGDNVIKEQKNWTSRLPVSSLLMMNSSSVIGSRRMSGSSPYPVMLTLPQLNYQLHCAMSGYAKKASDEAILVGGAPVVINQTYHKNMTKYATELMHEAASWMPIGVNHSKPNYVVASHNHNTAVPIVTQCAGVAFTINIWGGEVGSGSTLWLRLAMVVHDARESKSYKVGENDIGTVSPTGINRWYMLPRFEAVVNNAGYTFDDRNITGYKFYTSPIINGIIGALPYEYRHAPMILIGVCFDASSIHRTSRLVKHNKVEPLEVNVQELPTISNQIQVLLSNVL